MALPHLLKYVYTHGSDEVIRRGKKIHAIGFVELIEHDDLFGNVNFRVKDDSYATFYQVVVQNYKDPKSLSLRCSCPYNLGEICRHEAAALMRLQEMIDKGMLLAANADYDQQHTVAKMKAIEIKTLRLLCSQDIFLEADKYVSTNKPVIEYAKDETVKATVFIDDKDYRVLIRRNEERNFDTSSDYIDTEHLLCLPKVIVFLHLYYLKGANYFDSIRNWDKEKNKLLEAYGYSLNDELKGKFEFNYKDGKPFLRVLDGSIKRITAPVTMPYFRPAPVLVDEAEEEPEKSGIVQKNTIGIVFNFNASTYPYFIIDIVSGDSDTDTGFSDRVEKLELAKYIDLERYNESERNLINGVRKLQNSEIGKYINRNSPFAGFWENIVQAEGDDLPEETSTFVIEYMVPKLKKLSTDLGGTSLYILKKNKSFKTSNLEKVQFSKNEITPHFYVGTKGKGYEIDCFIKPEGVAFE